MDLFPKPWLCVLGCLLLLVKCSCDDNDDVKCTHPRQIACGDHLCCCDNPELVHKHLKAVCQGWKSKLHYIPKLPHDITRLLFVNNSLPSLTKNTFANISSEKYSEVVLIGNNIQNISADAFSNFYRITDLDLSDNQYINISQLRISLREPRVLRTLQLRNLNISYIGDDFFAGMHVGRIRYINLGINSFIVLNMRAFHQFKSIRVIVSTGGKINGVSETTENETFHNLSSLVVSHNAIRPFQPKFCDRQRSPYPHLKKLDLSYNNIELLKHKFWNCLHALETLILSGNQIAVIQSNTFHMLPKLISLTFVAMKVKLRKIESKAFNNPSLEVLNISYNSYAFDKTETRDIFKDMPKIKTLDVSGNNMYRLTLPYLMKVFSQVKSIETLIMKSVKVHDLYSQFIEIFHNLSTIILDDNSIYKLDQSFKSMSNLRNISLKKNKITMLTEKTLSTNNFKTPASINLANNPFECTCELLGFRHWIDRVQASGIITLEEWPNSYYCNTPSSVAGKKLVDFFPTKVQCATTAIILGTVIPSSVLMLFFIPIALYRRRWHIFYYFYKLRRNRHVTKVEEENSHLDTHDVEYDGYVIYHDEDREFVHTHLKEIVEDKLHLRLYIWHRDAGTGSQMEVMFDAIHNCRNSLAVISKHFLQDKYCHFQLEVAFDRSTHLRKTNVLLVLLDTIEFQTLSKYWCVMLTKTPTLRWTGNHGNDIKREVFENDISEHLMR